VDYVVKNILFETSELSVPLPPADSSVIKTPSTHFGGRPILDVNHFGQNSKTE